MQWYRNDNERKLLSVEMRMEKMITCHYILLTMCSTTVVHCWYRLQKIFIEQWVRGRDFFAGREVKDEKVKKWQFLLSRCEFIFSYCIMWVFCYRRNVYAVHIYMTFGFRLHETQTLGDEKAERNLLGRNFFFYHHIESN